MKKWNKAENILSKLDLEILRTINKKQEQGVFEIREKFGINPLSARRHIIRLQSLKLIERKRVDKTNRAQLNITEYGKQLLELFDKILKD